MGIRGPKRTPLSVRKLEGNPSKRALPADTVLPDGAIIMPSHVGDGYAAHVWRRVVGAMPDGVYRATDDETLAAYCLACERMRTAHEMLTIEGHVIYERKIIDRDDGSRLIVESKPTRNPWGVVMREATKEIAMLGTKLGLDPIARENIKQPEQPSSGRFVGLIGIDGGKVG